MKSPKKKRTIIPESIDQHIEEEFKKSPEFRKAYMDESMRLQLAYKIMQLRKSRHLSQAQLAKRMHTTQQTVSRLEDPQNVEITLSTLSKLAVALRARLSVDLVPQQASK
ncbi:MAG: XRE family transcriptional regulator [Candidatus Omnitrophota bacterium]|nr:MAG: XRE family transcriptional regulator [Candidatus Omnitrophota bacterium]